MWRRGGLSSARASPRPSTFTSPYIYIHICVKRSNSKETLALHLSLASFGSPVQDRRHCQLDTLAKLQDP